MKRTTLFSTLIFMIIIIPATSKSYICGSEIKFEFEGMLTTMSASSLITGDEKQHDYPALLLQKPASITCKTEDEFCIPESEIQFFQLVLNEENWKIFKQHKGEIVAIFGTLYSADNGYHYTPFLLHVNTIKSKKLGAKKLNKAR